MNRYMWALIIFGLGHVAIGTLFLVYSWSHEWLWWPLVIVYLVVISSTEYWPQGRHHARQPTKEELQKVADGLHRLFPTYKITIRREWPLFWRHYISIIKPSQE